MVLSKLLSSHVRPASWCTSSARSWVDSSYIKARSQSHNEGQTQPLAGDLTSMCDAPMFVDRRSAVQATPGFAPQIPNRDRRHAPTSIWAIAKL